MEKSTYLKYLRDAIDAIKADTSLYKTAWQKLREHLEVQAFYQSEIVMASASPIHSARCITLRRLSKKTS